MFAIRVLMVGFLLYCYYLFPKINMFCLMVFNLTFNNISVISRRSVLFVEETGGSGKKLSTCSKSLTNFIT